MGGRDEVCSLRLADRNGTAGGHSTGLPSVSLQESRSAVQRTRRRSAEQDQPTLRGLLRGCGLKVGEVRRGRLAAGIRELVSGHTMLERIAEPMQTAREALWREFAKLHREVLAIVKEDQVCRGLMTVPGVDRPGIAGLASLRLALDGITGRMPFMSRAAPTLSLS